MNRRAFFILPLWALCYFCASSSVSTIKRLAGEIAQAENRLAEKTVAVFTPETRGLSQETEALEICDKLIHEIVAGSNLKVVERSRLNQVLKEHELVQSGAVDAATAARLGRLLSVNAVVIGVVTGKADRTEIFLRLVDSSSGVILKTARGEIPREKASGAVPMEDPPKALSSTKTTTISGVTATLPSQKNDRRVVVNLAKTDKGTLEESAEPSGRLIDVALRKGGAGGFTQIIGRVENTGKAMLGDVRLSVQLYDNRKNLLAGAHCVAPDRPVLEKEKLPFSCLFKPPTGYANYEISFEPAQTFYGHRALALTAKNLRFGKATGSTLNDYSFSGIITNNEETEVTYPRILLSLFDASGKFIGSSYGFAVKKALQPGESSPFHISVYGYSLHGKPANYEAFYSGLLTRSN